MSLILGLNESATELSLARQAGRISFEDVRVSLAAYGEALERILGPPPGPSRSSTRRPSANGSIDRMIRKRRSA